jgi:hypothetical protein
MDQLVVDQELGFANLAMGVLGMSTLLNGNWIIPAALVGCLFLGLAGIRPLISTGRNLLENSTMLSNLMVSRVLLTELNWRTAHKPIGVQSR